MPGIAGWIIALGPGARAAIGGSVRLAATTKSLYHRRNNLARVSHMPIFRSSPGLPRLIAGVFLFLMLAGCSSLEARLDEVLTPDVRERAEKKGAELREELDALLERTEAELRDEARRLVIDGLLAP